MDQEHQLTQNPVPGARVVKFCGDTVTFTLGLAHPENGTAWVRTNIGRAAIIRREIIRQVDKEQTPLGRGWFDIPMKRLDARTFQAILPLCECGHFEAKCFFSPQTRQTPIWPAGPNTAVNVDRATACCANIIYNAFVRQFGPYKAGGQIQTAPEEKIVDNLDKQGYTVIPPSGTFRDLITELDFIFGTLGCTILMLLPIHPTPTTYGRMGRFGSPYAALSFTTVDPALARFDPRATPLEQFIELVDAVHQRCGRIFIDIAINHTGWAADLHESHPRWLARDPEGKIEVPGAWGVSWEDLTRLDYRHQDLWQYMADVFLTWCGRGVDGFRCDAGYMIPAAAWKYIVARVRDCYPDTVFLLEGLGGKIAVTRELLNTANLNWAYSELFQNYDRGQIENYLPQAIDISATDGIAVHFAETHDNPRLAARSQRYARMRTALCALFSCQGAFGFANGVEWYATEKIDVHRCPSLNWGAQPNQVEHLRRLSCLLKTHPAFGARTELKMIQAGEGNHIVLRRRHLPTGKQLVIVANLDDDHPTPCAWTAEPVDMEPTHFFDLLSAARITVSHADGRHTCTLAPGQVVCLTTDETDLATVQPIPAASFALPVQTEHQQLRAWALEVVTYYNGTGNLENLDPDHTASQLKKDPLACCARLNPFSAETRVITWQWPRDLHREVMLPPGHFLLVQAQTAFRARLENKRQTLSTRDSLPDAAGVHFALFAPTDPAPVARALTLRLSVYSPDGCRHETAPVRVLPSPENAQVKRIFSRSEVLQKKPLLLGTNGRGAMLHIQACWGQLSSRYDALLAANISDQFPVDRWVMFTRCRIWVVFQDFSQALNTDCLQAFAVGDDGAGYWRYHVPTGQGEHVIITVGVKMTAAKNSVQLFFHRHRSTGAADRLDDSRAVRLILRPDVENRNFHETTKAYTGPEERWPHSITDTAAGFEFTPDPDHHLRMQVSAGIFVREPHWQYMVHRAVDAERGLDPDSDLFSPGYFTSDLTGDGTITLTAHVNAGDGSEVANTTPFTRHVQGPFGSIKSRGADPPAVLTRALDDFVVARGDLKSVIAGYPWFLDWGRDALIFVRGLIAAGRTRTARAILKQFGRFEQQGTLPNMIRGNDAANRDTSDAPLWFIIACRELIQAENTDDFLQTDADGRTIGQILVSIARSYRDGTPNGIRVDPETGLVFSPAHFTWMDTDHPAGSPRQGYPVEIQALWYAALQFLSTIDTPGHWQASASRVREFMGKLFWQPERGYLSDCLHADPGQSATRAAADDALRPNQLLAITLEAVEAQRIGRPMLHACQSLLVPGAIRSLADQPVQYPMAVIHHGKALNDPHHPYQGHYIGDEDTRRKPAYHNGTAWSWLFPSFCEAWALVYGEPGRQTARAWLTSGVDLASKGCLGHIPEILDGDFPHTLRGCDAQAWGASELLRVWKKLDER